MNDKNNPLRGWNKSSLKWKCDLKQNFDPVNVFNYDFILNTVDVDDFNFI